MKTSEEKDEKIIEINEEAVKDRLGGLVRETVEATLNTLLDAEADALCNAEKYVRSLDRKDTRAGHYSRKLETKAGVVNIRVPKLRKIPFESAIIQRYQRREISVEEALVEMYLAGVSVRRVENITKTLWGHAVSPGTISNLNHKVFKRIEEWRNRPIEGEFPYVYLDGIVLKRSWAGEVRNVSVLVAAAVNSEGFREILGAAEGAKEDLAGWQEFLRHLKGRGLKGVRVITSDKCLGLVEAVADVFPEAKWQRCMVHFHRNVLAQVPRTMMKEVAAMLKAIHAQEDGASAKSKADAVVIKLREKKLTAAAKVLQEGIVETLTYMQFPREHRIRIRTNNPVERIMKEIRRRTRVVGAFPDGESALMLTAARLRHIAHTKWGTRRYLEMSHLYEQEVEERIA